MWITLKIAFSVLALITLLRATYISDWYNAERYGRNGDFDQLCDTALFLIPLTLGTIAVWFLPLW